MAGAKEAGPCGSQGVITLRGEGRRGTVRRRRTHLLTVIWHPDLGRVGEVARIPLGESAISRTAPHFTPPRGGAPRPLADERVSRRPVTLELGDRVRIRARGALQLLVDGRAVRHEAALEEGAIIAVGGVVMMFHSAITAELVPRCDMGLIGESPAVRRLRAQIEMVARHEIPVLIRGEPGVGKALVARAIHDNSPRRAGTFVIVDMGALPRHLASLALFGGSKGASVGADGRGYFRLAEGSTIFLDEVGDAAEDIQAAVAQVLEHGTVRPVGASRTEPIDVRLIAATDADLERAVDHDKLRLPWLMRLAGYELAVPPLRERRDDIARLFVQFLRSELALLGAAHLLAPRGPSELPWLPPEVMIDLVMGEWPGNVRELRLTARRIAVAHAHDDLIRGWRSLVR